MDDKSGSKISKNKYKFMIYDLEYGTKSGVGNKYRTLILDIKDFDDDMDKMKEYVSNIREETKKKNRLYRLENRESDGRVSRHINKIVENPDNEIKPIDKITVHNDFKIYKDGFASTMCLVGMSKSGKSTLFKYIYEKYYTNKKWISFLYTGSPHIEIYKNLKNLMVLSYFDNDVVDMIETQRYINSHTSNNYSFLNIFDDILNVRHKELANDLILTYRNSNVSSIISIQDLVLVTPMMRNNFNSVCLFNQSADLNRAKLVIETYLKHHFKQILGSDCSMDDMIEFYQQVTKDHGFIHIVPSKQEISFHRLKL
jgi:hypothetical protein